jgi:hypothetical protein
MIRFGCRSPFCLGFALKGSFVVLVLPTYLAISASPGMIGVQSIFSEMLFLLSRWLMAAVKRHNKEVLELAHLYQRVVVRQGLGDAHFRQFIGVAFFPSMLGCACFLMEPSSCYRLLS